VQNEKQNFPPLRILTSHLKLQTHNHPHLLSHIGFFLSTPYHHLPSKHTTQSSSSSLPPHHIVQILYGEKLMILVKFIFMISSLFVASLVSLGF